MRSLAHTLRGRFAMGLALHDQLSDDDNPVVLVIDDDPDVREGLRSLLNLLTCKVGHLGRHRNSFGVKYRIK